MSSEQQPPRKKQKSDSGCSRVLRSQSSSQQEKDDPAQQLNSTPSPSRKSRTTRQSASKTMSESRRRSSRKSRNDELRDNEQSIAAGSVSAKSTPSRRQSTNRLLDTSSHSKTYAKDLIGDDDYEEMEDEEEEEEEEDDDDDEESERVAPSNIESAAAEESPYPSAHRARPGHFGLGAMASLLSNHSAQLKSLLASLREPDPSTQLVALNELANLLSMSTEESLAGYMQVDAFVFELVNIMRGPNAFGEENPEMMLLACRCLANLMEAMPSSTANIAYGGAIPVLCSKLLEIQFIDLAEQALSTLEKISKEYPTSVVTEGGLGACLTYLDFFSTNVQRTAVNTAANCAKNIPLEAFPIVRDVIPILQNVVLGSDAKVVEAACLCLTRIIDSFKSHHERLEELVSPKLLETILAVMSPVEAGGNTVSEFIHTRFLHSLSISAKVSCRLACQMMNYDLVGTIYQLLTGLDKPTSADAIKQNSVVVLQALIHRPRDQVTEILSLISEVLPGLPNTDFFKGLSERELGSRDKRGKVFLSNCAQQYEQFATIVLPTLLDIYNSTVNMTLRKTALVALLKLCYNLEAQMFKRVVNDVSLAAFVTGVLSAQDQSLVLCGVLIAKILLERVAEVYALKLAVEGCVAEIEVLDSKYGHLASAEHEQSGEASAGPQSEDMSCSEEDEDEDEGEVDEPEDDGDEEIDLGVEEDENHEAEMAHQHQLNEELFSQSTESSVPSLAAATTSKPQQVAVFIGKRATEFMLQYNSHRRPGTTDDGTLKDLERLATELSTGRAESAFDELSGLFERGREISSYYLRSSGILEALLEVLTGGNSLAIRQLFLEKCMSTNFFDSLVSKLQESLSRAERFEVATTSSSEEKRSASVLAKQLRLKLVADESSDVARPYRSLMVSIHAIATFKALDDYLRPRIASSASSRPSRSATPIAPGASGVLGRAPEGLQGALAQLAAAGSSLPESIRARLAGLGVDTNTLLGLNDSVADATNSSQSADQSVAGAQSDEIEEAGPPVSVEVPVSGGKAIAKTAEGTRIATPRTSTPGASPTKTEAENPSSESQSTRKPAAKQGAMSYAAAVSSVPKDWHIQFEVNGQLVSHETTIFGAVSTAQAIGDASTHVRPLSSVYLVKFRKVQGAAPIPNQTYSDISTHGQIPSSIEMAREAAPILRLLSVLYALNMNWKDLYTDKALTVVKQLEPSSFVNLKLTAKLNRQLEEPLIVASQCLPTWSQDLPRFYPFLFPFETRYLFLQSTSFGYSRSMTRWQTAAKKDRDNGRPFLGRLQRQKVRISRPRMLESAMKVLELYGASPSVLEVEYFDEVGTGLGPTLEFYSTVSKEFSKKRLHLWRDSESNDSKDYVFAAAGLFPQPLPLFENEKNHELTKKILAICKTLGTFVARSMLDSRMIDISFNPAFFRLLGDYGDLPTSIGAIYGIDKSLAKSLSLVKKFSDASQQFSFEGEVSDDERCRESRGVIIDEVSIEDLGLDFTYPGSPDLELIPGGNQVDVTIFNVSEYLAKVVDMTLGSGIRRQLDAFKDGFSHVFPYGALRAFTPLELTMVFGRSEEDWSIDTLLDSVKADHGYTMDSATIRNLVHVLSELGDSDRRDFLQFITGSPKLPIGGFKSLTPQFTIVCKPHEAPLGADDYLPSVMTCVNYLKMPDYTSIDVLRRRLFTAMKEGGGSFHLS